MKIVTIFKISTIRYKETQCQHVWIRKHLFVVMITTPSGFAPVRHVITQHRFYQPDKFRQPFRFCMPLQSWLWMRVAFFCAKRRSLANSMQRRRSRRRVAQPLPRRCHNTFHYILPVMASLERGSCTSPRVCFDKKLSCDENLSR